MPKSLLLTSNLAAALAAAPPTPSSPPPPASVPGHGRRHHRRLPRPRPRPSPTRFGRAGCKLVLAARHPDELELARDGILRAQNVTHEDDILLVTA